MGSNTAKGYPYPVGTDRVMDGDDAIHALASKVDELLPARTYVTSGSIPVTASVTGQLVVTFPVGRFAATPRVQATPINTTSYFASISAASSTSVTIIVRQYKDTAQTVGVLFSLMALQMLADAADG